MKTVAIQIRIFIAVVLVGLGTVGVPRSSLAEPIVFHRGNGAEPDSLDHHKASGTWENNIIGDMILGLMTEDAGSNPIFGAAEAHEMSADGLVHTFKIREDMTWSDGIPVTADDFVFAFQRILDPKTAAQYAAILYPIKNALPINKGSMPTSAIGARAIGPKELEVTLEGPTPYFLQLLTHYTSYPVPKHVVEVKGDQWIKPENLVVNGPYKLAQWIPNSHVHLVKNAKFYEADKVQIDEIFYYPISDSSIVLKRFRAGELDAANDFPTREYKKLKSGGYEGIDASEARAFPYTSTTYVQFNTTIKPFNDPRVRRALSLVIDRSMLTDKVLGTGQVPAYALVPPGMPNYTGEPRLDFESWPKQQRLEEAARLLNDAGYTPDSPLTFTFKYRENLDNRRVAIALQSMWKEAGINAQLFNSETRVHYNSLRTQDFEAADAGWVADYADAENYLFLFQSTSGQMNYGKYDNPAYDALMTEASQTLDLEARAEILAKAERIILDDQPIIPLFFGISRNLVSSKVEGWEDNLLNWHRTRYLRINQ